MRPSLVVLFAAVLALSFTAASAEALKKLKHVTCDRGRTIVLKVKAARANVDGVAQFNTRLWHLNDQPMVPGPVIEMEPGKTCRIRIENALSSSGNAACMADMTTDMNVMHCPDIVNLHTHGLHVSPTDDDITVSIWPGQSHSYRYEVPSNHLMGTHWYHAHHHGSVSLHTMGGLAGMLLVKPSSSAWDAMPSDVKALYKDHSYRYEIIMNHIFLGAGDPEEGDMAQMSLEEVAPMYNGNSISLNPTFSSSVKNFYAVNGQYQPTINVASGSTALFRMLHAVGTRAVVLKLDKPDVCEIRLIARDGVFQQGEYIKVSKLVFIQATRADYAVKCTLPHGKSSYTVKVSAKNGRNDIGRLWGNVHKQDTVFTIKIGAPLSSNKKLAMPTHFVSLPNYLQNLLDKTVTATQVVDMDDFAINGIKFPGFTAPVAERYLYTQCLNKVYRISLSPFTGPSPDSDEGEPLPELPDGSESPDDETDEPEMLTASFDPDAGTHAYHQHINHFQIEHFFGKSVSPDFFRVGEWRDTAAQFVDGMMLRSKPMDYSGEIYFHCHVTQHEDMGMMALYNVKTCP